MEQYKNVDIANSKFVGFTYERLLKREAILSLTIADPEALDIEIEEAAALRREVRACKAVFEEFNIEDPGACVADVLEVITGDSIERLQKQTAGGLLAVDIWQKTGQATKTVTQGTLKATNNFATWLANKTQTQA